MDSFSAGFQIQIKQSTLDASYVGSRGSNVESSLAINNISLALR
jgi:hypothetical protein